MPETEKITINMSAVDLGKIDLLVQEGLYSNRTDFIRTGIRNLLDKHVLEIQQSVARHSFGIGIFSYSRNDLEGMQSRKEKIAVNVIGMLNLADDISAELAEDVIESVRVRGIFLANEEVKAILSNRMN